MCRVEDFMRILYFGGGKYLLVCKGYGEREGCGAGRSVRAGYPPDDLGGRRRLLRDCGVESAGGLPGGVRGVPGLVFQPCCSLQLSSDTPGMLIE